MNDFDPTKLTVEQLIQVRDYILEKGLFSHHLLKDRGVRPHKMRFIAHTLDWSKTNTQLSRENGVSINCIRMWRNQLGKPNPTQPERAYRPPRRALPRKGADVDWEAIDWANKHDGLIAAETGFTREFIRQKRARLGKPKVYSWELRFRRFQETFAGVKELTFGECRARFPDVKTKVTWEDFCLRAGITPVKGEPGWPKKYPWELLDFRLPSAVLADIWGMNPGLISTRRSLKSLDPPLVTAHTSIESWPQEVIQILTEQTAKATEYSKTKSNGAAS